RTGRCRRTNQRQSGIARGDGSMAIYTRYYRARAEGIGQYCQTIMACRGPSTDADRGRTKSRSAANFVRKTLAGVGFEQPSKVCGTAGTRSQHSYARLTTVGKIPAKPVIVAGAWLAFGGWRPGTAVGER